MFLRAIPVDTAGLQLKTNVKRRLGREDTLGHWVTERPAELSPEHKGCDCAAAVGGRDSLFLWPGGGMGAEGAGGGKPHLPLLPRLLIAAA